jgi:hypothetical protein
MEKDGTYDISALVSVILQAQFHPFSKVIWINKFPLSSFAYDGLRWISFTWNKKVMPEIADTIIPVLHKGNLKFRKIK